MMFPDMQADAVVAIDTDKMRATLNDGTEKTMSRFDKLHLEIGMEWNDWVECKRQGRAFSVDEDGNLFELKLEAES